MAEGQRLIGNSAFLLLDWIIITVLSLMFWLVIGKTLPKEVYGIVATAVNIIIILSGVALLGLNTTMIKMISEFNSRNQMDKIKRLVRFSIKVGMSVSAVFAAVFAILSGFLSETLNLPVDVILLISIGILIFSAWGLTTSVLYGFQSMKRVMTTNMIGNIVKLAVTIALVFLGFSYFGPLVGLVLSVFAIILMRLDTFFIFLKKRAEKIDKIKLDFKAIITYSISAIVASIAMVGFANTPNIILNALAGPAITGLFAISLTITSPIFSIPSVLNSALFPITSSLTMKKGGKSSQKILINMVLKYAAYITLPLISILLIFSGTIILFFSSGEFLEAKNLLPIIGFAAFLFGIGGILNMSIYAIRKPNVSRNITILTLVMFLALSIPLTLLMSVTGMAIAYLTSIFVFFITSMIYLRKFIGFSPDLRSLGKIAVAVLIFSGVLFGIDQLLSETIVKLIAAIAALVMYIFVLIPLRFYKKEDLTILDFLSKRAPVGKKIFSGMRNIISEYV
jgi:O-antigen/teichoic acid export membrane protein